jgi:hypothetical protein
MNGAYSFSSNQPWSNIELATNNNHSGMIKKKEYQDDPPPPPSIH